MRSAVNFVSRGFAIRASGDHDRMTSDCRYGNLHVPYQPGLEYGSMDDFKARLSQADWMIDLDQRSSHCHFRLYPSKWRLVGFVWEGEYYVCTSGEIKT